MPTIPTLRPSTDVAAPGAPALDRERRPTANFSSIIAGIGALTQASQLSPVNAEPFIAAAGAGKSIGGAIMNVAHEVTDAAHAQIIERSRVDSIKAEALMDETGAELESYYKANPTDTAAWSPQAQKLTQATLAKLQKEFPNLTRTDREILLARGESWAKRTILHSDTYGKTTDFAVSRDAQKGRIETLRAQGRLAEADAATNEAQGSGVFWPHEIDAEREQNRQTAANLDLQAAQTKAIDPLHRDLPGARDIITNSTNIPEAMKPNALAKLDAVHGEATEKDELQAVTLRDPTGAIKRLDDPTQFPRISAGDKGLARDYAVRVRDSMGHEAFEASKELVDMLTPEEVKSFTPDKLAKAIGEDKELGPKAAQMSPYQRYAAQTYLEVKQKKASQNDPLEFAVISTAIDNLPAGDDVDSQLKASRLMTIAEAKFSGPHLESLKSKFDNHMKSPTQGNHITGPAMALVDKWAFDDNAAGVVNAPVMEKGAQVFRDPKKLGEAAPSGQVLIGPTGIPFLDWIRESGANPWINDHLKPDSKHDVLENDGKPVPVTKVDEIVKARVTDQRKQIADKLKIEVDAGRITTETAAAEFVAKAALKLGWNLPKGGTQAGSPVPRDLSLPAQPGKTGLTNYLLPPPSRSDAEKRFDSILKK